MNNYNQIEIQKLSSSTKEDHYLLCCNGHYYEANYPIVELLEILRNYDKQEDASLLIGGITWFSFPKEMGTTLQMNKTVSRQQSNRGRINAMQIALAVFPQRALLNRIYRLHL